MSQVELRDLVKVAVEAAYVGGKRTLAYFNTGIEIETKADNTPVTRADRECEMMIREMIGKKYPRHAIVGEEHGEKSGDAEYRWIIDPIDGTKSFIRGVPAYKSPPPTPLPSPPPQSKPHTTARPV